MWETGRMERLSSLWYPVSFCLTELPYRETAHARAARARQTASLFKASSPCLIYFFTSISAPAILLPLLYVGHGSHSSEGSDGRVRLGSGLTGHVTETSAAQGRELIMPCFQPETKDKLARRA